MCDTEADSRISASLRISSSVPPARLPGDEKLAAPFLRDEAHRWGTLALIATTVVLTLRTKLGLVWMVLAGGVVGALGWV